ncbi:MAG: hypothetical protein KA383_14600 [Phycisphaerae bacterium]|nr:hypothetical protein [Phycisphaerae bacterium]
MLRQVPRKAQNLPHQPHNHLHRAILRVEPRCAQGFLRHGFVTPPIQCLRQHIHAIERQTERFTHIAHRRSRTIADDFRGDRRPLAPVFFVDVLKHFLPPFVLEVDVNIRRLVAFATDEALEQQVDARRIDRGDAEAIAHRRVRGRPAPLTQNPALARKAHQVPDGEEVVLVFQLGDQGEFGVELASHRGRKPRSRGATEPRRAYAGNFSRLQINPGSTRSVSI